MKAVLTHQFALDWAWPQLPQPSTQGSSTGAPSAAPDAAPVHIGRSYPRRFGRTTRILSLTSDPFPHALTTRRVAVCASTGPRLLLPLVRQEPPSLLPCGNTAYWRLGDSQEWSSRSGVAHMAEVIVGEMGVIEHLIQLMRNHNMRSHAYSFPVPRVCLSGERRLPVWNGRWVMQEAVQSFVFHSVPFKVLWLSEWQGLLVVSLPCEERVVTLYAAPRVSPTSEPVPLTVKGSFSLPRGVVPLDVTDIEDRPFVAIGTYEHGVFLCSLDASTGAISHIVRAVAVRTSQAVYPVVHVASLFPSLGTKDGDRPAGGGKAPPPPWAAEARRLGSLNDGALLCSSPYDGSFALVKLSDGRDGVPDDFPTTKSAEPFQFVTRNSEGVWATTLLGGALLFHTDPTRPNMNGTEMRVGPITPVVRAYTMHKRGPSTLLCLTEGQLVYQGTSAAYVRERRCFWMAGVDDTNTLVLYNCRTSLAPFEKFRLPPMSTATSGGASGAKEPPSEPSEPKEPEAKRRKGELAVTDMATGVAFIFSASGVVQVAAAHNKNVISIVTWNGNADS